MNQLQERLKHMQNLLSPKVQETLKLLTTAATLELQKRSRDGGLNPDDFRKVIYFTLLSLAVKFEKGELK